MPPSKGILFAIIQGEKWLSGKNRQTGKKKTTKFLLLWKENRFYPGEVIKVVYDTVYVY